MSLNELQAEPKDKDPIISQDSDSSMADAIEDGNVPEPGERDSLSRSRSRSDSEIEEDQAVRVDGRNQNGEQVVEAITSDVANDEQRLPNPISLKKSPSEPVLEADIHVKQENESQAESDDKSQGTPEQEEPSQSQTQRITHTEQENRSAEPKQELGSKSELEELEPELSVQGPKSNGSATKKGTPEEKSVFRPSASSDESTAEGTPIASPKVTDDVSSKPIFDDKVNASSSKASPKTTPKAATPKESHKPTPVLDADEDENLEDDKTDYVKAEVVERPLPEDKPQTHTIVIPSYSTWFSLRRVSDIEKKSLPEFFNNVNKHKTEALYIKYRNFMVNTYRMNPNEYLTVTACRRNLIGDAGTIMRVHRFLNRWGLINYQVNAELRPQNINPVSTESYRIDYDTPRGLFPFETYKPPTKLPDLTHIKKLLRSDDVETTTNEPPKKKVKLFTEPDKNQGWNEEKLGKLFEGIKQYGNNWNQIAQHVGDKTPEQCILRFLELPIEDKFLEENPQLLGPLKYIPRLPFSPVDNPVMSTLAFLATLVDHSVASAASTRAIRAIEKIIVNKIELKEDKSKEEPQGETTDKETNTIKSERKQSTDDTEKSPRTNTPSEIKPTSEKEKEENKEEVLEKPAENVKEREDPLEDIKDAGVNSFGIVASRAHVFATYEERELHKHIISLVNQQMKLVDIKLAKVSKLEKEFEFKKKKLKVQQERNFLERISLSKSTGQVHDKLMEAVNLLENCDSSEKIKSILDEAKELALKPSNIETIVRKIGANDANPDGTKDRDDSVKPISLDSPQLYRYWSG
ncbi:SWI/SNF chromatin-remodeling complex subunit [Komagataella phaffii CBS 7435]|uniref:Subunit of the SWI/SNF chromatin remodeling complex n=2 Tax=Komagataella phaffii TaxID=460519 RepID=C4QY27_KOMPG|nr:Subunit of the SWI/SNF chromatin remodeling complex [Komagataella phaffii GS115]AOA60618.1 GQ67_01863T0 [Komagataella phaffii]CAH2446970.1 SWI/SNF chromatin-remodeling complex subunit [Komagataella phaffii CBS 7435]AOA66785.1 GQ68_01878T0 [Komagataella phaffii GS115]CAY68150.1 Subunit of the SWI/SNF chromatin remodeling complex [Komagataella phaffii GS115]CCA37225.1 SWI/SNF chromatin-remodeling complex subunit [Komagataella phaffii CBS 7435]